ncbi:MAG TPA: phosphonate ABC transporter ATP-binding protein [Bacteroidales bacterium]|nr:MAG: phosphonate ABC transporter ATP-binding protein [Bacteroidetes bacterium GWF2_33_38]OFY72298.1 MAG: phosphonate ABC transporter ATP-binding protein [Bacteroidetes bacterium RIFOXYA12_FULL_33_9]OFY91927.1 MAG: phosphonate ABC transporter ATP-binding protein [Bacteroidetes bacterium RIFOXYA2_FULL_33_7]HBF87051.1 phosphonate ABC transporter ATP-binding protein [Bacteroidales bacterium]
MSQLIKTIGLTKVFRNEEIETSALNNVSLEINQGDFVAIMGPSGCGKTTLLNILGLLDAPSNGNYYFLENDTRKLSQKQKSQLRKNNIGFVFQNFNLIDELTVFENIELPLIYLGLNSKERKIKVEETLDQMHILHRKKNFPVQLSGGQQQRVALARAIISNPKLILADEPTGNLDSLQGDEVMSLLAELNRKGTTIIMVTHSERDAEYSQRIVRLFDGKIINENMKKIQNLS